MNKVVDAGGVDTPVRAEATTTKKVMGDRAGEVNTAVGDNTLAAKKKLDQSARADGSEPRAL